MVTWEALRRWLDIWDRLLNKPRDVALGRTFDNALRAANIEFNEASKPNRTWRKELVDVLRHAFDDHDAMVDIYRWEYSTDIESLDQLVHFSPVDRSIFDAIRQSGVLPKLAAGPSPTVLRDQLRDILENDSDNMPRLTKLAELLLRSVLDIHTARDLGRIPSRSLAQHGSATILAEQVGNLAEDDSLNEELTQLCQEVVLPAGTSGWLASLVDVESESIVDLFPKKIWWRYSLGYNIVRDIGSLCAVALVRQRQCAPIDEPTVALVSDQEACHRLGMSIIESFLTAFFRQVFATLTKSSEVDVSSFSSSSPFDAISWRLGDKLASVGWGHQGQSWGDDHRPTPVDLTAREAITDATEWVLAKRATQLVMREDWVGVARGMGREVARSLASEGDLAVDDWRAVSDEWVMEACTEWTARRAVHKLLVVQLRPLNEWLLRHFDVLRSALMSAMQEAPQLDRTSFWANWVEHFSAHSGIDGSVAEYLPWTMLREEELGRSLDSLVASLRQPSEEWNVIYRVQGLRPEGRRWSMGGVTFYDPTAYDYGEGRLFSEFQRADKPGTCARLVVRADARDAARQLARAELDQALDILTFARSVGVAAGGFNPHVESDAFVIPASTRRWSAGGRHSRAELHDREIPADDEFVRFCGVYDHLAGLASADPGQLTDLQDRFLRALQWYRKGRWEPDLAERFSFYWIAFEQLFVHEGELKVKIFDRVPPLHITWRNLPYLYWLPLQYREAVRLIENSEELHRAVEAHPDLEGWREAHMMLRSETITTIASLVPAELDSVRTFFAKFFGELEQVERDVATLRKDVEWMRDMFRFRLHQLYDLRNVVFHEARTSRPLLELYVEELEQVLEGTLKKMAEQATPQQPQCNDIDELTAHYQRPWP